MSIDVFGRRWAGAAKAGTRGPPGVGFKTTVDNQYDIDGKKLCNIADPHQPNDAANLKTVHEVIKKGIEACQSAFKKSFDDLEEKFNKNAKRRRSVEWAIYNYLSDTAEFLIVLDERLATLERLQKADSIRPDARRKIRIVNRNLLSQLEDELKRDVVGKLPRASRGA